MSNVGRQARGSASLTWVDLVASLGVAADVQSRQGGVRSALTADQWTRNDGSAQHGAEVSLHPTHDVITVRRRGTEDVRRHVGSVSVRVPSKDPPRDPPGRSRPGPLPPVSAPHAAPAPSAVANRRKHDERPHWGIGSPNEGGTRAWRGSTPPAHDHRPKLRVVDMSPSSSAPNPSCAPRPCATSSCDRTRRTAWCAPRAGSCDDQRAAVPST